MMAPRRVILLALCLAGAPTWCTPLPASSASSARDQPLPSAPDFTRTDLNGIPVSLHNYRGKLVLLNFWATWCAPCLTEIPAFITWQTRYGPAGLQIVGISMDDDSAPVKRAYQKYRFNYPIVMADAQLGESFGGVLGLPLSYLIDAQGHIIGRYQGVLPLKKLEALIRSYLPRQPRLTKVRPAT
jgi:cytochrome c biogenesis protein CcmG/thiol:disulfide interchange protein DsbE